MLKKLLLVSLVFTSSVKTSEKKEEAKPQELIVVVLPNADVLTERLNKLELEHFVERSNIIKNLASQQKNGVGVVVALDLALYDYNKNLKDPMMAMLMQMQKADIIEAILEDHPEVLKQAKDFLASIKASK